MPEYTFTVNGKKYTAKSDKPLSDAELTKLVASMSGSAFTGAKASAKAGSDREFVNQLQSGKWLPVSASSKEAYARRGTRPPATVEDTKRESEAFTEPIKNFAIEALGQIQPLSRLGPGKKGIGGQVGTVLGSLVADPIDALIFDSQIASNPNATFWEKAGAYTNLGTKVALPGATSVADEVVRPIVSAISKTKPVSKGLEAMANALGRRKPSFTTAPTTAPSSPASNAIMDSIVAGEKQPLEFGRGVINPGALKTVDDATMMDLTSMVDNYSPPKVRGKRAKPKMNNIDEESATAVRAKVYPMAPNKKMLEDVIAKYGDDVNNPAAQEATATARKLLEERHGPVPTEAEQMAQWAAELEARGGKVDAPEPAPYTMPPALAKSSPNYTAPGTKGSRKIVFADDYDKAAYILANDAKRGTSKSAPALKASLEEAGADIKDVIAHGKKVVEQVKAAAAKQKGVGPIKLKAETPVEARPSIMDAIKTDDIDGAIEALRNERAQANAASPARGKGRKGAWQRNNADDWERAVRLAILHIRRGARNLDEFAQEAVQMFGAGIRDFTNEAFLEAKRIYGEAKDTFAGARPAEGTYGDGGAGQGGLFGDIPPEHAGLGLGLEKPKGFVGGTMDTPPEQTHNITRSMVDDGTRENPTGRNIFTEELNQFPARYEGATWGKNLRDINRAMRLADTANRVADFRMNMRNLRGDMLIRLSGTQNALNAVLKLTSKTWRDSPGNPVSLLTPRDLVKAMSNGEKMVWNGSKYVGEGELSKAVPRLATEFLEQLYKGDLDKLAQVGITVDQNSRPGIVRFIGNITGLTDFIFEDIWYNIIRTDLKKANPDWDDVFIHDIAAQEAKSNVFLNSEDFTGGSWRKRTDGNRGMEFSMGGSLLDDATKWTEIQLDTNTGQLIGILGDQVIPFPKVLARAVGRKGDYAVGAAKAAVRWHLAKKTTATRIKNPNGKWETIQGGELSVKDKRVILNLVSRNLWGVAVGYATYRVYQSDSVQGKRKKFLSWLEDYGVPDKVTIPSFDIPLDMYGNKVSFPKTDIGIIPDASTLGLEPRQDPADSYDKGTGSIIQDDKNRSSIESALDTMYAWNYITDPKVPLTDDERQKAMAKLGWSMVDAPHASGPRRFGSLMDRNPAEALGETLAKAGTSYIPPIVKDIGDEGNTWERIIEKDINKPRYQVHGFGDQIKQDTWRRDELMPAGPVHPELGKYGVGLRLSRDEFAETEEKFNKRVKDTRSYIKTGVDDLMKNEGFQKLYKELPVHTKSTVLHVMQEAFKSRYEMTQEFGAKEKISLDSDSKAMLEARANILMDREGVEFKENPQVKKIIDMILTYEEQVKHKKQLDSMAEKLGWSPPKTKKR